MSSEFLLIAGLFVIGLLIFFFFLSSKIKDLSSSLIKMVNDESRKGREELIHTLKEISDSNEQRMDRIRDTVDQKLRYIQESNEKKLDQMRQTVDETLQSTLERRIGESFKMVSERLEAVQQGLGEMRSLAKGVGDLKKVLSNVKVRGIWGEIQLDLYWIRSLHLINMQKMSGLGMKGGMLWNMLSGFQVLMVLEMPMCGYLLTPSFPRKIISGF